MYKRYVYYITNPERIIVPTIIKKLVFDEMTHIPIAEARGFMVHFSNTK